jgi:hypothetical protein
MSPSKSFEKSSGIGEMPMRERLVVCGGLPVPRNSPVDTLTLEVNAQAGSPHKVNLHLGDLSRPMADNIPDVLTDVRQEQSELL